MASRRTWGVLSGFVVWIRENRLTLPADILWAATLLAVAATVPQVTASAWYRVGTGEASLVYTRIPGQDECESATTEDATVCVPGSALPGAARAD